jgi:acyl-CoA thioesterase-1
VAPTPAADSAAPAPPNFGRIVVLGDSLAVSPSRSVNFPAELQRRIDDGQPGWAVVNASVSGETTAGGASRIAGELARHDPDVVVIELGANDGLRGLDLAQTRANLEKMVVAATASGARVLLLGMRIPPNYGRRYTETFASNYAELAEAHDAALLPFLLEPIAADRTAFQADQLHPSAAAQPRLRDHVWTALEPLLD